MGAPPQESGGRTSTRRLVPSGMASLWLVLFAVWTMANGTLAATVLILGAVLTGVLAYLFTRHSDAWSRIRWTPTGLVHFLAYFGVFLVEMVKANIAMMGYVYAPRIAIRPGIVKLRTRLVSPIGRLALANTVSLTPGSLCLAMEGDALFLHWLDVRTSDSDAAAEMLLVPFERHLEKVFG